MKIFKVYAFKWYFNPVKADVTKGKLVCYISEYGIRWIRKNGPIYIATAPYREESTEKLPRRLRTSYKHCFLSHFNVCMRKRALPCNIRQTCPNGRFPILQFGMQARSVRLDSLTFRLLNNWLISAALNVPERKKSLRK